MAHVSLLRSSDIIYDQLTDFISISLFIFFFQFIAKRHIHVPTCHFPAPVWCGRQYYKTAMLCSSWHIMAMNIYLPSVGVLLKGHNKWW